MARKNIRQCFSKYLSDSASSHFYHETQPPVRIRSRLTERDLASHTGDGIGGESDEDASYLRIVFQLGCYSPESDSYISADARNHWMPPLRQIIVCFLTPNRIVVASQREYQVPDLRCN